jgi:hypothetical protein
MHTITAEDDFAQCNVDVVMRGQIFDNQARHLRLLQYVGESIATNLEALLH